MSKKTVSVVYICDDNYVMPTCVSIQSIYENKMNTKYDIYILGIDLSENNKKLINKIKLKNVKVHLFCFENKYENLETNHLYVSKAALYKFDIANILSDLDKVLYIDCDTIVMGDLAELFNTDIKDYYAAVVKDLTSIYVFKDNERIGTKSYFNSGMMLLNLTKIREEGLHKKLLEYKLNSKSVKYMDQDCFNAVFAPKVKFLACKYNYMTSNEVLYVQNICNREKDLPVIIHLTPQKPWKVSKMPYIKEWNNYLKKSICKKHKLEKNKSFIYKEKIGEKRIIHIGPIKVTYHKSRGGGSKHCYECNFKTYNDLYFDIKRNLCKIPEDIGLIVGIPRSGMIPAYMIGFMKNLQVISINEFISGDYKLYGKRPLKDVNKNVLVIDDTCCAGIAINQAKEMLKPLEKDFNIKYMAVYSTEEGAENLDIFMSYLTLPRMFSWNYMNHGNIELSCFDMDGVLCEDPDEVQNDDGEKYIDFIKNAKPLFIPKYKIKAIVTSRLEKYRKHTEDWLRKNNVMYEKLYMLNLPNKEARLKANVHAPFKAKIYKQIKTARYFYESNREQAQKIFELSGKTTICVTTDEIFQKS